jgi:predicted transcriptional regulator
MLDSYFAADRQRRSRLELKIIVMQAIAEGKQRQSHIMYYAKLPTRICASLIRNMEQQGLIEAGVTQEGGRKVKRFSLTERGKRALDSYLVIMNALKQPIESLEAAQAMIQKEATASPAPEAIAVPAIIPVANKADGSSKRS